MESGTRLGPYEILEQLGAGGMGEVWLAEDTRLHRKIAIKVLPEEFATDPERLARFEQEARAAAALNHPHIAAVFDVGHEGTTHFMVQEYLEGKSLRDLLRDNPPKLDRALAIGAEVAEALAVAHKAGIVHRDIKPDNIFITEPGHTKVLDFGLAKLVEPGSLAGASDGSLSPTAIGTMAGAIMGTVGYMAPEQVEAGEIDGRTDIFALGCVLYEMTTGQRPFQGENIHATLGLIVSSDPEPIQTLRRGLPTQLHRIIAKCMAKSPAERYQHADDLVVDLRAHARELELGRAAPIWSEQPDEIGATLGRPAWMWPLLALLGGTVVVLASFQVWRGEIESVEAPRTFTVALPSRLVWPTATGRMLAIAPDGSTVAYVGTGDDDRKLSLWVWDLTRGVGRRLEDTGASPHPFFSPDGSWLGFMQGGKLKKMAIDDGRVVELAEADILSYGTWGDDGSIVISRRGGLYRLSDQGGPAELLLAPNGEQGQLAFNHPQYLPGSQALLFDIVDGEGTRVASLRLSDRTAVELVGSASFPEYTRSGHLLFARGKSLYGARFDPDSLRLLGPEVHVLPGLAVTSGGLGGGAPQYAIAADGTLVYVTGKLLRARELVWVGRDGTESPATGERHVYRHPRLSPDSDRVAVSIEDPTDPARQDVWLLEPGQGTFRRLTFSGENFYPRWSPDGRSVGFTGRRGEIASLFSMPADFSRQEPDVVLQGDHDVANGTLSPDGRWFVYRESNPETGKDVLIQPAAGDSPARPLLASAFDEHSSVISPDGQWIAFVSNETGRDEILVTTFPEPGGRWQVSNEGGSEPVWSPDGSEIFYRDGNAMVVVQVTREPEFRVLDRELLFVRDYFAYRYHQQYDVSADGQRLLLIKRPDDSDDVQSFTVVINWLEELRRTLDTTNDSR